MGALKVWDGSAWQTVASDGKSASVFVGPDAPTDTAHSGDLWYDTDDPNGLQLPMSVINGGTGATTAPAARTNLAVPSVGQSASTSGAPSTGTWARGDTWIDVNNVLWACTASGSPGTWMSTNRGEELSYTELTGSVSITATTEAGAQQVITSATRNYDGAPILIEFVASRIDMPATGGAQFIMQLWDGATNLGWLCQWIVGGQGYLVPVNVQRRLTPSVGSHTYRVCATVYAGTGAVQGGPGGTGQFLPAYLRITRV